MKNKMRNKSHRRPIPPHEAGYSLIEIAIALVIIGLVVGAALKGYDVLENAQLKSIMMQVNEYRLAIHSFEEKYGAFPGTLKNADKIFSNFNASYNGSGKNVIGQNGLSTTEDAGKVWIQLAAANLIGDPGTPEGAMTFGKGAPATKLGGGITLEYAPEAGLPGLWFIVGEVNGSQGNNGLLTPQQTLQLLKQFDSDTPNKGRIRAKDGKDQSGRCVKDGGQTLNLESNDRACVLYVRF
jgi:prepilin-type N-terminal cleavage/methylation domain-containing protein